MTKPLVYIVIYSLYHHVYKLSLSVKEGLESRGVEVKLFQVQETLSDEILSKMQAPSKPDLPIITVDKLSEPDGILFGLPTRFGTMPAQMKALLDASGALWAKGALAGKFAGTFFSTASQHGGQETTALTAVTYFAHHGMMYVPFGYANSAMGSIDEVVGGSAYGCGTISDGDGSRQPSNTELSIAENQGANFGEIVSTFVKGREVEITGTYQNTNNLNGTTTNPPVSSSVDTNQGAVSDQHADSSHAGSNIGAGVAGAGAGVATGAAAAIDSSMGKRSSTSGDNTFRSTTDNNEITSVNNGDTSANKMAPPTNATTASDTGYNNLDNKATGTDASLNSNGANPATSTTGATDQSTGLTSSSNPITGTDASNTVNNAAGAPDSGNATGTDTATGVNGTNTSNNTTTGTNNLGGAAKTGVAGAVAGATTAGATGIATAGATGAGATAGATNAATTGTNAATNAATTAAGKSTNAIKESLVKSKDKTKKKRWFCC